MVYMVRIRDVLDGRERWLDDAAGKPMTFRDRQAADCAALAMSRYGAMELAYVIQIDPMAETIREGV